jgi:hypothetical protein
MRAVVRGVVPADQRELVTSNVPTLLLSGYRDPVTPPSFAERVAKGLPNGYQVLFPDGGHSETGSCGRELTAQFIEQKSAKALDVSCVAARKANIGTFGLAVGIATLAGIVLVVTLAVLRKSRA